MHKTVRIALSLLVLAVFSGVGFLNFYRTNAESLSGSGRVIGCYLIVLAIAVAGSLMVKALWRRVPVFQIFLVAAIAVFMLFCYDAIKNLVGGKPVALAMACWACATILACVAVGKLSKQPVLLPTMAIVGLVYLAPAAMGMVKAAWHPPRPRKSAALALTARNPRNVYWIVLDGYPRADVLRQFFDFDNSPFLRGLRDLGFAVYDRALASFPETVFSIPSTLSLGFLADAGPQDKVWPMTDLYPIVRGQSVVVDTVRAMGYSYIHFQNGYDNLTQCPLQLAICVRGNGSGDWFDEFNVALWSNTPLIDIVAIGNAGLNVDETSFVHGAVHDLTGKLAEVQAQRGPFFLYGHILAPHLPIRFRRDCSIRNAAPDLLRWDPADRPAFLEQLACVNNEATDLVGKIVRSDPDAIVVVQSDHGTAFRGQFKKPFDAWDSLDLKERFGALNAIRMPAPCADDAEGNVDLVNTFTRVLSCISGSRLPDKVSRQFVVSHADMVSFHEYTGGF